jgi:lysophospholipase L1-like esterase
MEERRKISPAARRIVLAIASVVFLSIALLCVEIFARVALPFKNPLRIFVKPIVVEDMQRSMAPVVEFDAELSYRLRPGIRGGSLASTIFNSNNDGVRRDGEIGRKPANGIRVLCVGDSCTFGFGVPFHTKGGEAINPAHKPYAALLEDLLRASFPGRTVEVINVGVPGYSSSHGVTVIGRNLPKYDADIVTAMFFNNDIVDPGSSGRAGKPKGLQISLRKLSAHSQFVTHLIDWSNRQNGRPKLEGFGSANTPLEDYVTNFDTMRATCAKHGAEFVVINPFNQTFPENDPWIPAHRITEFREALKAYVRAANLPFLDIPELTEAGFPANKDLFIERVHPNTDGHTIIAKRLHDLVQPIIATRIGASATK